ncbi:VOC family protein [Sinorhizobium chiapasense]|uniref:VOC family protein n=1 Tax=Sinorhizobium chiapasense TaxID=501572 RepID=A0ABZ2BEN0_9HYPH
MCGSVIAIDHVQLAMPEGGETEARRFYSDLLGIPEVPKPENLAARRGGWFERPSLKIHLGVEKHFVPARKAHPAFIVDDLFAMVSRLQAAGAHVVEDEPLAGFVRRYVCDPFGNRIELMQPVDW